MFEFWLSLLLISVYIATQKPSQTLVKSRKSGIFYFSDFLFVHTLIYLSFHYCIYKGNKMLINHYKYWWNWNFLFRDISLSYMDLTQYLQSAEFPMFRPSGSGSGGVENSLLVSPYQDIQNSKKCQKHWFLGLFNDFLNRTFSHLNIFIRSFVFSLQ